MRSVFVRDLQKSFWGDFQGRTRGTLQKLWEADSEQQMAEYPGCCGMNELRERLGESTAGTGFTNARIKTGIKVGDHLSVERVTKEIKDPASGAVIRRMTSNLGEIEVTDVDEISAVCKVVSGSGMKVGDMAKTMVQ